MSWFRCNKWQDRDGVWHYQMIGPGRSRRARRKWQRAMPQKVAACGKDTAVPDKEFEKRLGYLSYLFDRGIIRP